MQGRTREDLAASLARLIEERYKEKLVVSEIAKELYVNESYLIRTFKEKRGITPLQYHNKVRIDAAKDLLVQSDFTVAYISDTVGYVSQAHFTRVFVKQCGCTPTEYRRKISGL